MAYSINATIDSAGASSSGASISVSTTYASGETPIIFIEWAANTGTVTLTDGTNDAKYAQIGAYVTAATAGGPRTICAFWCPGAIAGTYTLVATFNSSRLGRRIAVAKVSGLASSGASGGGQNQAAVSGTDSLSTGNITPSAQPALLLAVCSTLTNASAVSAGTGFTGLGSLATWDAFGNNRSQVEHKRLTSTSAVAATATPAASDDGLNFGVIIPESTGGAALAGNATAAATGTGALTTAITLASSATASATGTGALSTSIALAGSATAAASATAALSTSITLAGQATAAASGTGALSTAISLASAATAVATASASLTTSIPLAGAAIGQASASAALTTSISLAGAAAAQASGFGSLTTSIPLAGSASAAASAFGSLTTAISLAGQAVAQASATGDLTVAAGFVYGNDLVWVLDERTIAVRPPARQRYTALAARNTRAAAQR